MGIYSKLDLLSLEDTFENEFSLNILCNPVPDILIEKRKQNIEETFLELIENGYILIVQYSILATGNLNKYSIITENNFFRIYIIDKKTMNLNLLNWILTNEYDDSLAFFLIKSMDNVKLTPSKSSRDRLSINVHAKNEVYLFNMDLEEIVLMRWN